VPLFADGHAVTPAKELGALEDVAKHIHPDTTPRNAVPAKDPHGAGAVVHRIDTFAESTDAVLYCAGNVHGFVVPVTRVGQKPSDRHGLRTGNQADSQSCREPSEQQPAV